MVLITLLSSLFSIYPWNLTTSTYLTQGEYSNGNTSISKSGYISMDRRGKDGFIIGYRDLLVKTENGDYRQFNWMARDIFWIKPSIRLAGIAGHIETNNKDYAWISGVQIEGDLPWFGYSHSYIRSDYQNYQFTNEYSYNKEWVKNEVEQIDFHLSKKFKYFTTRIGLIRQQIESINYYITQLSISGKIKKKLSYSLLFSQGENKYAIDPYLLIINNNPEILTQSMSIKGSYKINPNLYISGVWTIQSYENFEVDYLSIGITGRY
ncbi:MAG: hypothetical protein H8E60_03535 [Candidatus Marinimicrobia bacterium]|nr:hypothetical protein [Candidatus Neomarinimicrobiota bacterium]